MKYLQVKLDDDTHALLTLAKVRDREVRTLEGWTIKAIEEKLEREGLTKELLRKPAGVAGE